MRAGSRTPAVMRLSRRSRRKCQQPHLIDHVLQLGLRGVLTERTHHGSQLLGRDRAITILVEQGEGLLELSNLLLGKLVCSFTQQGERHQTQVHTPEMQHEG